MGACRCSGVTNKGLLCVNKAKFKKDGKRFCGVHIKSDNVTTNQSTVMNSFDYNSIINKNIVKIAVFLEDDKPILIPPEEFERFYTCYKNKQNMKDMLKLLGDFKF